MIKFIPHRRKNLIWLSVEGSCDNQCTDPCPDCEERAIALSNWTRFSGVKRVVLDFEDQLRPNIGILKEILHHLKHARVNAVICGLDARIAAAIGKLGINGRHLKIRRTIDELDDSMSDPAQASKYTFDSPLPLIPPHLQKTRPIMASR